MHGTTARQRWPRWIAFLRIFKGLAQELRGDVLVKLGRSDDARKAYETALASLSQEAPQRGALADEN